MNLIQWPEIVTGLTVGVGVTVLCTPAFWRNVALPLCGICKGVVLIAHQSKTNAADITDLKHVVKVNGAQTAIAIDQNKVILELLEAAVVQYDVHGDVVWVSDRWTKFAGIQRDEAIGNGWIRSIHGEEQQRVVEAWKKAVADQSPLTIIFRFTTGYRVQSKAVPIEFEGDVVGYRAQIEPMNQVERQANIQA